ncbi:succinate dehydrogenase subunit 5, mitochondrial-like isoform X2 [Momordica charantia]|uniref:Succinate dehydrogenase subunit 5, mitochondrial-like isoform X2 n=1 Tax=Momordica charantia TaxID=3673 RepID=A0A6J1C1T2_MOMCH|nr:succinate dehydrogenase subunit 5, mitochondrial-like isoform X2 [Momordica charantia]
MEKMVILRSLLRSVRVGSYGVAGVRHRNLLQSHHQAARSFFYLSSHRSSLSDFPQRVSSGRARLFSVDVVRMATIEDSKLQNVFKDLMATSWDELPNSVVYDVKAALSGSTDDKAGKEVVENVFRAAEAVEEFGGILISLKMKIDDSIGLSGEDVKPLSDELKNALHTVHDRYTTYLDAFGPEENYLRKKVETDLGTKMIYLKIRCSGLGSEWGKVSVLGTSGLSGSYVEQRA